MQTDETLPLDGGAPAHTPGPQSQQAPPVQAPQPQPPPKPTPPTQAPQAHTPQAQEHSGSSERTSRLTWFFQNTSSGLVVGALSVTLGISLAALIYGGDLEPFLGRGIGLVLLGSAVLALVVSALTSVPGMFANAQDAPAAVLGALSAGLAAQFVGGVALVGQERFLTTVVIVAGASLATGALFLVFGLFRLGNLVRYLPYPVLGGFMAGTGWLLLTGGIGIMSNVQPSLGYLADLFAPGMAVLWMPGLALAIALLIVTKVYRNFLVWPGAILGATLLFYAVMLVTGGSVEAWRAQGLMLGQFPAGSMLAPPSASELEAVRWSVVVSHLPTIATVAFISLIALLLNAIGVEKSTGRKVDLNRELRAAGLGNLLGGSLGGTPGYQGLSFTVFNINACSGSRYSTFVAAMVVLACVLFGAGLVALIPKAVLGGLVAYFGLKFLVEWLYQALFDLPVGEYLIVVVILGVIVAAGVLPGVGVGLALTVALFVISSSRIDAVRYAVGGADLHSRVTRSQAERAQLAVHGGEIMVVQLQGFLFFGTATALLERLERRVRLGPKVSFVILDFSRVSGVDSTGLATIGEAFQLGRTQGFRLLLSGVKPRMLGRLSTPKRGQPHDSVPAHFANLDAALEHAEEKLLDRWGQRYDPRSTMVDAVAYYSSSNFDFTEFLPYLTRKTVHAGQVLINKGDVADDLYFLVEGQMTAYAENEDGSSTRLETLRAGGIIGELGFYRGGLRSATVRADVDSKLLVFTERALARVTAENPKLAADLHMQVARLISGRVLHLMAAVDALER